MLFPKTVQLILSARRHIPQSLLNRFKLKIRRPSIYPRWAGPASHTAQPGFDPNQCVDRMPFHEDRLQMYIATIAWTSKYWNITIRNHPQTRTSVIFCMDWSANSFPKQKPRSGTHTRFGSSDKTQLWGTANGRPESSWCFGAVRALRRVN